MSSKFIPFVSVTVLYNPDETKYGFGLDERLRKIAKKYKGEDSGSGFGMGQRDIDFEFNDLKSARKFLNAAYKFKGIYHIYSKSYLYDNDHQDY